MQAIVDAVLAIRQEDKEIDLHMVEIMEMMHQSDADTKYVYFKYFSLIHLITIYF